MSVDDRLERFSAVFDEKDKIHCRVIGMFIESGVSDEDLEYLRKIAPNIVEEKLKINGTVYNSTIFQDKTRNSTLKRTGNGNNEKKSNSTAILDKTKNSTFGLFKTIENSNNQRKSKMRPNDETENRKKKRITGDSAIPGVEDDMMSNKATTILEKEQTDEKDIIFNEAVEVFNKNLFKSENDISLFRFYMKRMPYYLYSPLQCKLCGLRYNSKSTEEFGVHIEDHRRRNRALDDKMVLRREFFTQNAPKTIIKLNLIHEDEVELLRWNKEIPICIICNDPIKKNWRDDIEEWVLEDGVKINEEECSHRKCLL